MYTIEYGYSGKNFTKLKDCMHIYYYNTLEEAENAFIFLDKDQVYKLISECTNPEGMKVPALYFYKELKDDINNVSLCLMSWHLKED